MFSCFVILCRGRHHGRWDSGFTSPRPGGPERPLCSPTLSPRVAHERGRRQECKWKLLGRLTVSQPPLGDLESTHIPGRQAVHNDLPPQVNQLGPEDPSKSQHSQQVAEQVLDLVAFPLHPKRSIHLSPLLSLSQELTRRGRPHPALRGTDFVSACRGRGKAVSLNASCPKSHRCPKETVEPHRPPGPFTTPRGNKNWAGKRPLGELLSG